MKRLLLLSLGLTVSAPLWAANDSPSPVPATPGIKWSLVVLNPRVAAGALPGEEHHSEFVIRAVNARDVPVAGVPVELPSVWKGKEQLGERDPDEPEIALPHVEWPSKGKTTRTDAKGEARGRFTSGQVIQTVMLHGPAQTEARIEQVWNDEPDPSEGSDEAYINGYPLEVRYKMSLRRGSKMIPICGHRFTTPLQSITLSGRRLTGVLGEEGAPQREENPFEWKIKCPVEEASPEEQARWKVVSAWVHTGELTETSPGVYEGTQTVEGIFEEGERPIVDGIEVEGVAGFSAPAEDQSVYEDN